MRHFGFSIVLWLALLVPPALADVLVTAVGAVASNTYSGYPASNAIDGDPNTFWSAGAVAPQWIQVDLGQVYTITRVRMLTAQSPAGNTVHNVYGRDAAGNWYTFGTASGDTTDDQWLEVQNQTLTTPIRYIYVQTTTSPSWVGWREIQAYAQSSSPTVVWTDSWSSDPCIVATTAGTTPPIVGNTWTGCNSSPKYWLIPNIVQGDSRFTPSCTSDSNAYNCFHAKSSASTLEMHGGNNFVPVNPPFYDTGGDGLNLMTAVAPAGGKTKNLVLTTSVSPTCSFLNTSLQNYCFFALDLYDGESDYRGVYVLNTQYGGYAIYRFDFPGASDPIQVLGYLQQSSGRHGWVYCQSDGSGGCLLNSNAQLTPGTLINLRVEYDGGVDGTTRYYVNNQLVWTDAGATYGLMLNDPRASLLAGSTGTNSITDPRQYMKAIIGVSTLTAQ